MSGMDDMSSTGSGSMDMKMYFHGSIGTDMLWFASWMPTSAGATVGVCIALFILAIFERYLMAFRRACDASWRRGEIGYALPRTKSNSASKDNDSSNGTSTSISAGPDQIAQERRSSTLKEKDSYNVLSNNEKERDQEPVTPYSAESGPSAAPSYPSSAAAAAENEKQETYGYSHLPPAVRKRLDPLRNDRWSRPFRLAVDIPRGVLQSLQTLIHYLLMLVVMTFNIWWVIAVVLGSGVGEMLFGRFGSGSGGH